MRTPTPERHPLDISVAVFSNGTDITLCNVDETAKPQAVADGYSYCGFIAIDGGVPRVECEPGFEAAMILAGADFAEMLGPRLKAYQLSLRNGAQA